MQLHDIRSAELDGKRVLLRVDFNVPFFEGKISDTTRIQKTLPTIQYILEQGGYPVIASHFGRPKGQFNLEFSLSQLVETIESIIQEKIIFFSDIYNQAKLAKKGISLLENLRFYSGETDNDASFSRQLACWGDIYCNDAFSVCHRSHASMVGITKILPSYAGIHLQNEINQIDALLGGNNHPSMAIIGGAKISTKIAVLMNLTQKMDTLIIGGAMGNTFLKATGHKVGTSLVESDHVETANKILQLAKENSCQIALPIDACVSDNINHASNARNTDINSINEFEAIFDVGPKSIESFRKIICSSKTVIWNGPLGAFEYVPFNKATLEVGKIVAENTQSGKIQSIVGGGDTIAALSPHNIINEMGYVSTAGGAFIEYLEGNPLPGIEALRLRNEGTL